MKKILKIGGYARVSTDEQKKFGYSISAQTDDIYKVRDVLENLIVIYRCGSNHYYLVDLYLSIHYLLHFSLE